MQARRRLPTPVRRKSTAKASASTPQPLPKPNVLDPLGEPTRHRRIWAAYLAAGFTRREFAHKLGTNYHTVNRWDSGAATISLDMLERASVLVGYSMDELCFGREGRPLASTVNGSPKTQAPHSATQRDAARAQPDATVAPHSGRETPYREAPIAEAEIRALFDAHGVDVATRAAFGQHAASPAGRYQSFTASYVEAWCSAYAHARSEVDAMQAGVNARALAEAVQAGQGSVTPEMLRSALGRGNKS